MTFLRKTPVILAFSALTALAAAVGCSREEDMTESGSSDLTSTGTLQELVISQVYGGGGNAGAAYTHDYVELFNQSDHDVDLAGKTLQYVSSGASFTKAKNLLTLPDTTAKLAPGRYFLIQLATGAAAGATPVGQPLTDVDYVATQPLELIAMSKESGKVALVANLQAALEGCGGAAPAVACDSPDIIDLVGYGSATQFRGGAPVPALASNTAAIRHSGGCAHSGDNSLDFQPTLPAPRNGKTIPSAICSTVDASAPPPAPIPDAGPKPEAGAKDASAKDAAAKDAAAKDAGPKPPKDAGKHSTTGDDDDDDDTKPGEAGDDDDDDDDTGATPKEPAVKSKKSSTIGTSTGAQPPAFPATAPDCTMGRSPVGSFSGLGAIFGLALAGAALRRRKA